MSWDVPGRCLGGEGGIRTPDTRKGMPDFESGAFNRALPPLRAWPSLEDAAISAQRRTHNRLPNDKGTPALISLVVIRLRLQRAAVDVKVRLKSDRPAKKCGPKSEEAGRLVHRSASAHCRGNCFRFREPPLSKAGARDLCKEESRPTAPPSSSSGAPPAAYGPEA